MSEDPQPWRVVAVASKERAVQLGDAFVQKRHAGALGLEWYDEDPEPVRRAR